MLEPERSLLLETLAAVCGTMLTKAVVHAASDSTTLPENGERVFASVGLTGKGFRGSLSILGVPGFFRAVYPAELGKDNPSPDDLDDWACEISNQLLSRLKNQLARRGLDFALSTPTVVRGNSLRVSVPARPVGVVTLRQDSKVSHVFLEITHEAGLPLLPADTTPVETSPEGEGGLF
jgi:CheY-specific phosphatase CheX